MKKTAYLLVVAVILCAVPVFAQGPFNDVPTDHWAYDAVNTLQKDGIVIGYPDGTFGGKRAMSRYEFAVAIARILPMIQPSGTTGITQSQLNEALAPYVKKSEVPNITNLATKADVDALRKLVDEFRDEIAALGVDVDALKRDVCALAARVEALEAEQKRVRFTGDVNVFGIATSASKGVVVDQDQRVTNSGATNDSTLLRNVGVVKDFDLNISGRVNETTRAIATINYGNYLNYLAFIDDYVGGTRPNSQNPGSAGSSLGRPGSTDFDTLSDNFFPYYLYIDTGLCKGDLQVGRFPIQWTPYTLKKIDVDSYTSILKTDDGNYPMDGVKLAYNFGGVDLTMFAAKNNENDYMAWGLTGQPSVTSIYGGMFDDNPFNEAGGHAVGGLTNMISQSAGVRANVGTPWKGNLGLTYYQAWAQDSWTAVEDYDQARVFGADLTIPFGGNFGFAGSWTESDTLANNRVAGVDDIDDSNTAWDAKINAGFGKLGVGVGYKRIERNFAAAGAWDKIGRWTNPVNVKGPYVDMSYPIGRKMKLALNGEFLKTVDNIAGVVNGLNTKDDEIVKAEAGLKWGISKTNSLDLGYQWVRYNPTTDTLDEGTESYLTVGWAHQLNPNAGFKVGYQFINWDGGANTIVYGNDYRGGLGVVQFGVNF